MSLFKNIRVRNILIHTGKGGKEEELTREKVRGAKPVENTNMTD